MARTYTIKLTEEEHQMLCNLANEGMDSYVQNNEFETREERAEYRDALHRFVTAQTARKENA